MTVKWVLVLVVVVTAVDRIPLQRNSESSMEETFIFFLSFVGFDCFLGDLREMGRFDL